MIMREKITYGLSCVLVGLFLWPSLLLSQDKLKNLEQVQLLSQQGCVVVQVNADWNLSASIDISKLTNCFIGNLQ